MDYERLEILSKKLSDARIDIRLRTASNLLFKIESGIFDKDVLSQSLCISTLQNGILDSLSLMAQRPNDLINVNDETSVLLEKLLTLINTINLIDHGRQGSAETASKILELLYQLKTVEGLSERLLSAMDTTIDKVCGIRIAEEYGEPVDMTALTQRAVELMAGNPIPDPSAAAANGSEVRFHGAGAILNSRLVHSGWKFPPFVLTERDERWLFDVEVAVKLGREGAARELWAVLSDLPAQALLLKTNLLRAVLDLVGAPFSQLDVEADPLGLHALTALQWLEGLLRRCRDAFRVQMDGSLCCAIPPSTTAASSESAGDMTTGLAQAMFALRHPVLPSLPTGSSSKDVAGPNPQQGPIGALSALYPTPSFPGLAFACCAAALPLLQGTDSTICRAVHRLLQTALPFLLEPRLESSHNDHQLLPEEQARLQHLLNRTEQLFAFHSAGFNMEVFMELMDAEGRDTELSAATQKQQAQDTIDALRVSSCQLLLLSCGLEIFRAVPVQYLMSVVERDTEPTEDKVAVGDLSLAWLCRIAGARSSLETVLPGCTETAERCLTVLDPDTLGSIRSCDQSLRCAQIFAQCIEDERVLHSDVMLPQLVARAEAAADLLDASCPVYAPAIQGGLVGACPILLLACCESESDLSAEVDTLLALVVRTLSCGAEQYKALLLQHLVAWLTCPNAVTLAEPHRRLCSAFNLTARHGRYLEPLLATPAVIQALLLDTYFSIEKDTSTATCTAAVKVLEALCKYLLNTGLDREHLETWSTVLLLLKTLEWEPESAGQSHTARCTFARQLQDSCADSTLPAGTSMFAKSLVLGMFHTDSSVRISSVLRVRRDVLRVPLPSAVDCADESGADVTASLLSCDIFCNAAPQRLQSWKDLFNSTSTVGKKGMKERVPVSTAFTHADIRKVASIGLGDLEPSLRAPALGQVLEMLSSDAQLLHTADAAWVLSVTQKALKQLAALVPFTGEANSIAISAVGMQNMSDAHCRLLIETLRVLVFFFAHFWSLRSCATFLSAVAVPENQNSLLDVTVLLRVLFAASNLKMKNSSACEALIQVAPLCAQVLCSVVCSVQSWQPLQCNEVADTDHLAVTHTVVPASSAAEEEGLRRPHALRIPSFVLQRFYFPVPTSAVTGNEYSSSRPGGSSAGVIGRHMSVGVTGISSGGNIKLLGEVLEVAYSCQPTCPVTYPPQPVVEAVVSEVIGDLADRVHVVTATKLFGLIVDARNHAHLREALSCTLSVCAANPSMLHVFTALQLDLTTAVSKIITTCPRTQKDHLTLASALDFLYFTFASLLAHEAAIPDALQGDFTQLLRDTVDALLSPMAVYFTEHFERANTYFVNLTAAATSESEREYATASHAVCSAFFRLLHTLSAFLGRPTQLGCQLVGSPVVSILMHIGTSELHRANDRTVVLATLENIVRHHTSGWQALCCMENPKLSSIPGPSSGIDSDCDPLELLIRTVRLVRTPDSMQSTSVVVSALRLLHACLLQRMAQEEAPSWSIDQSAAQWKWLIRLLYDRRSEIKILAIELLSVVLRNTEDEEPPQKDHFLQTVDSLDPEPESKAASADIEAVANEGTAEVASWPPFELLSHIVVDSTESTALRCRAIELLVHCRTMKCASGLCPALKLGALMNAVFECLSLRDTANASPSAICPALSALHCLITTKEQELTAEVLSLARAMKVLPLVVEVLNVRTQNLLAVRALARVCVWDEAFVASERAGFFDSDALSLRAAAGTGMFFQGGGWRALQAAQRGTEADMLRSSRSVACWLLFELDKVDKPLFEECVHHSNLIHFLATSFSAVSAATSTGTPASTHGLVFEARSITAQAELLSMLISREGTGMSLAGPTASGALHEYIGKNPSVSSNLLKKVVLVLMGFKDLDRQKSSSAALLPKLSCISACLRLLCVMMNEALWRRQLGLGGGSEGETGPSEPCAYLFDLLLSLRSALTAMAVPEASPLEAERVSGIDAVLSRVDFCTALFMQYSYGARLLFAEYCIEQKQHNAAMPCLLEGHIAVIAKAVEFLSATPAHNAVRNANVGSSVTPQASRDFASVGAVTPEAKRALQGLKDRASARKPASLPASAGKAASSKVNQSISSWATRTSQGSRWRDKSRSYAWNRDRSDASSAGTTAAAATGAVDMPCALKLQVWSALLVLSSAFPACPETVDWAIELKLHQSLSKLLRFAGRHSNATLLNYPVAYSTLLGVGLSKSEDSFWCPSNGMLAAAISALCCAFIHGHEHAKQCLVSTGESAAAAISSAASMTSQTRAGGKSSGLSSHTTGTATSVHFLISLGVSKGVIPVSRWLSLALAGSLLYGAHNLGAPTLKSVFSQMIAISLQKSLHASHSDPDAVAPLLNTLTSFLAAEDDIVLITQLCRKDQGALLRSFQAAAGLVSDGPSGGGGKTADGTEDFKFVTFPELIQWVWGRLGNRPEVAAAVCRCLGRISIVDRGHRTIGNLLSEEALAMLCHCYQTPIDTAIATAEQRNGAVLVRNLATLALWNTVHFSEKAKGMVRELLARNTAQQQQQQLVPSRLQQPQHTEDEAVALVQARACLEALRDDLA